MRNLTTLKLDVGYGKKIVLEDINLSLNQGEILCLMGPNGSGKSTIIKTITNSIKRLKGNILIENINLDDLNTKERAKKLSVVLTERANLPNTTGFEVVLAGRFPHIGLLGRVTDEDINKVNEAIDITQANDLKDKLFSSMSDGEKQRIMIARAIAQESDVMIFDEPTSFLDIRYKIELLDIFRKLAREYNKIIILSLHEVDLVNKIADKVLLITEDSNYLVGSPESVLNDEEVKKAFKIKKGSFDTLTGTIELPAIKNEDQVFVIGGEGLGINIYRILNRSEVAFNVGVLFENDLDTSFAKKLALNCITTKSFEEIKDESINLCKKMIDESQLVIDCGADFTGINKRNEELLDYAIKSSKRIIYIKERNSIINCSTCYSFDDLLNELNQLKNK